MTESRTVVSINKSMESVKSETSYIVDNVEYYSTHWHRTSGKYVTLSQANNQKRNVKILVFFQSVA